MDSIVTVIDMQTKLLNVMSDKNLLQNSVKFLKIANDLGLKVIATQQYKKGLGDTDEQILNLINSKIFDKSEFSAFNVIKDEISGYRNVILIGVEAHICVYQSAKDLLNNGYNVTLVDECVGSRDERNKELTFLNLNGVTVKSTEMIAFEMMRSAEHVKFKDISKLIK
ncbi:TPA: isochorismatase family protein [Campylobacter fetus subsp. venerealis]|uniref:YcaC-related amidohydrolase n=1 Tax=Campylobacter fetus subsp. venerealis NCTC 10354 TaxID=983328 RepID=A0AAE6J0E2_CAMFE|nr:isochorismatase family protein [Campylobacter fetus]OCS21651.1 isochorismatase [Campylobacter fetus subsp. venerealis cfvi97/532]OCS26610.1 isochorismatase [Campylobacter fetus subsp. venerealis cfvB10]OCS29262.1 isochorismatase [Campylobacter fetus subsp. venerealis LMG 6570 = CCUG 33900]AHE95008.1 YcaC-related amidohydrolase [Campylobacter fetus subsp. venerealis cfvi03/293]AIR81429.1 YcaC-related amidohydrolase [Campylobacter fetus subsp. venerealis 97/608]